MLNNINALQWENRLILVNLVDKKHDVSQQLEAYRTEIDKRDIVWIIIRNDQLLSNYSGALSADLIGNIRQTINMDDDEVILIGKDGDIKSRLRNMDLQTLFSEIDVMPMRQYEMRE